MALVDILEAAQDAGDHCDTVYSGFDAVYLIPIGDEFRTLFAPEIITELPTIDQTPQHIILEPESAELRCRPKVSESGAMWDNLLSMKSIRNVSDWAYQNRFQRFWLLLKQNGRWLISGDEDMPYMIVGEWNSGKQEQDGQSWDIQLSGDQLRPYHILEEPEGGGEDPDPPTPPE